MTEPERVLGLARNALRGEPRVDAEHHPIALAFDDGILTLDGEVDDIIAKNPDKVADAKSNPKAIGWFVGQVMKASGGKADPRQVNELLAARLAGSD